MGEAFIFVSERTKEVAERKEKVLRLLSRGWLIRELATEFHVSESTIKRDIGQLMNQFGARNSNHLIAIAYDKGILVKEEKEGK